MSFRENIKYSKGYQKNLHKCLKKNGKSKQTLTGRTQLTASGLNTIGVKATLSRVTVHLDSQLHCTFCGLGFPLQPYLTSTGKTDSPPHTLSPCLLRTFSCFPFCGAVLARPPLCPGAAGWCCQQSQRGGEGAALQASPASSAPGPIPSPIARGQLLQLQRFYSRVRWPHGTGWETCGIPQPPQQAARHHPLPARRQPRQDQDSLPIVIIFALRRDLSHAAATTCLQGTKAMKTRLTKPACELFCLAWICHTSQLADALAGHTVSSNTGNAFPSASEWPKCVFSVRGLVLTKLLCIRRYHCCKNSKTTHVVALLLYFFSHGKQVSQIKLFVCTAGDVWPACVAFGLLLGLLLSSGS